MMHSPTTVVPLRRSSAGIALTPAAPSLWRVLDPAGRIIGHLEVRDGDSGVRYAARRFHGATHRFRELGEFWSPDDALECLRYAS